MADVLATQRTLGEAIRSRANTALVRKACRKRGALYDLLSLPPSAAQFARRQKASDLRNQEDDILILLLGRNVSTSYSDIADALHWYNSRNNPNKSKVQRLMKTLTSGGAKNKLVEVDRDGAKLTNKGEVAAKTAEYNRKAAGATYG